MDEFHSRQVSPRIQIVDDLIADAEDAMRLIAGLFRRGETGEGFRERKRQASCRVSEAGISSSTISEESGTAVRIRGERNRLLVARSGTSHEILRSAVREAGHRNGSAPFFKATSGMARKELVPWPGGFDQEAETLAAGLPPLLAKLHHESSGIRFSLNVSWIQSDRVVITPRHTAICGLPRRMEASGRIHYPDFDREFSCQFSLPLSRAIGALENALRGCFAWQTVGVPNPGETDAVFSGEAASVFWHEVVGHPLEASGGETATVLDRVLGAAIGPPGLDISDVPSRSDLPGGYLYDDEGFQGMTTQLVEDGRVTGRLTDGHTGGIDSNGHGRTPDFRRAPRSRMSNLLVSPGNVSQEELVARCGSGLFVRAVSFGTSDPESGRFILHAEEGNLIKRGKIGAPVSHFALHGYALNALQGLDPDLGNEARAASSLSLCVKGGDPLPVGGAAPSMLIRGVSVRPLRR